MQTEATMKRVFIAALGLVPLALIAVAVSSALRAAEAGRSIPLKEAKLNIEHNATDEDTGFQGAIDSEGWRNLTVRGPDGEVLTFQTRGDMNELGLTELFFETVEPANADVPIEEVLDTLPEGKYTISGTAVEDGTPAGTTSGVALLTHNIPEGPRLISPADGSTVPTSGVVASWAPVSKTITGKPVKIIAYQLIIEKDAPVDRHMIGKFGLSMYLPPTTTSIAVPNGFLEPATAYNWEVLAIEESGNQTLSSGTFRTR
jgi:hypothetical protein